MSFESSQIRRRIFAEAELLPASFITMLQLDTELAPRLIIGGLQVFGTENLLARHQGNDEAYC